MTDIATPETLVPINGLVSVSPHYEAVFCDVWGVLHDGERKSASAEAALLGARQVGAKVVLLTNSPRPSAGVVAQLDLLQVSREAYDHVVTSGDVTRALIAEAGAGVFHIGPPRDVDLFKGLSVAPVSEDEAEAVVVTGLYDDENEGPEEYAGLLARLRARRLPLICANPDIVVHRGNRVIACAGALARDYAAIGGEVRMAGKPYRPIYDVAARLVGSPSLSRILAIGDGLNTDIRGANDYGVDALLVAGGIHGEELGGSGADAASMAAHLAGRGLSARYVLHALK